ncbi:MAG: HAD family hydrolase [Luteolibacter sp.]
MPDFLFDLGKVLLDFNFEPSLATLLPPDHPNPHTTLAKLIEKKDEFETGLISADDYTTWALKTMGSTATPAQFQAAWCNIFTPNLPMWETIEKLRKTGHRLILFSNINSLHAPWLFENFPQFNLFQGKILSYQAGAIKPDPAIYHHATEKYNLTPSNTLYIDDLPANIQTGKDLGFKTHQYEIQNHQSFQHWLTKETGA